MKINIHYVTGNIDQTRLLSIVGGTNSVVQVVLSDDIVVDDASDSDRRELLKIQSVHRVAEVEESQQQGLSEFEGMKTEQVLSQWVFSFISWICDRCLFNRSKMKKV